MLIHQSPGRSSRVVVVEDDPSVAWLIAVTLADEGFVPVVVHDGSSALQAVEEHQPDAITLDLQLPGVDGRTVLRRLLTVQPAVCKRVIVVSSDAQWLSSEERRAIAGALGKPFNLGDLVQRVRSVTERRAS